VSKVARVPETYELTGDDAVQTMRTGRTFFTIPLPDCG
jgi:hypothetical protein